MGLGVGPISGGGTPYHAFLSPTPLQELYKVGDAFQQAVNDAANGGFQESTIKNCVNSLNTIINDTRIPASVREQATQVLNTFEEQVTLQNNGQIPDIDTVSDLWKTVSQWPDDI